MTGRVTARQGPLRFSVGSIDCLVIADGMGAYTPSFWIATASEEERDRALAGRLDEHGYLPVPYNCLVVRTAGRTALLDAGAGKELAAAWGDPVGQVPESLRMAGIDPDDIDVVVVSHGHPDHIGGLTVPDRGARRPSYPRARHYFWSTEWEAWTTEAGLSQFSDVLVGPARLHLPVLAATGLVELADRELDVLPGVRLIPAPGHTPGHMAVVLTSGGEGAIYLGDAITDELLFDRPDWLTAAEAIPALSLSTRKRLIERAVREHLIVAAFHLPSIGRVEMAAGRTRFLAAPV